MPKRVRVFLRRLRRFFITTVIGGVAVVLPFTIFVMLVRLVVNFFSGILSPMRPLFPFSKNISDWIIDLLSFGIVITAFFAIGLLVQTSFGSRMFTRLEERWLMQLPFYSVLRETVRQFFGSKKAPFSQVVLADVFNNGTLMTGFVTDDDIGNGYLTIFVPTGPNPTNGFIFHVPEQQVRFIDARPEDAMRTIIGVGTGSAVLFKGNNK